MSRIGRRVGAAALSLTALLGACSSDGETVASEDPAPTTVPAPALNTLLQVRLQSTFLDYEDDGEHVLTMLFEYQNTSDKDIVAWQFTADASVIDTLQRTFRRRFSIDCTQPPLATGASRAARSKTDDTPTQRLADLDNCTRRGWDLNPYIAQEAGMTVALTDGRPMNVLFDVTKIVFADGTVRVA